MKLPLLAVDKANHLTYGAFIAALVAVALMAVRASALFAALLALLASVCFAAGKEFYDRARPGQHTPDWRDAAATVAGGVLVAVPMLMVVLF